MGTFFKSFWSRLGRNTGNRVSNALYGDKWSTPYRATVNSTATSQRAGGQSTHTPPPPPQPSGAYDLSGLFNILAAELEREDRRDNERQIRQAFAKVSAMRIPRDEDSLVDMLQSLSVDFAGAKILKNFNAQGMGKQAANTLRNAIFQKYSQALAVLEQRFPRNPLASDFFIGKWRMFFARKPWNWIWVAYAAVLVCGTYQVIVYPVSNDIALLTVLWLIPVIWTAAVLISRHMRLKR